MFNCLNIEQRREYQGLRPRGSQGKDHPWLFRLPFEGNWIPLKGFMKKGVLVCLVLFLNGHSYVREENGLSRTKLEARRSVRRLSS